MKRIPIESHLDYYVNEQGEIFDSKRRKKKLTLEKNGYLRVTLTIIKSKITKSFLTHRLVALTFIPNPDNKPHINHINGIKTDNRVENLEWCTSSENHKHAYRIGLQSQKGEKNTQSKLTPIDVYLIRNLYSTKQYIQRTIANMFGVKRNTISYVINNKLWSHIP